MNLPPRPLLAAFALVAFCGLAAPAWAQNALGDGRGLERDLRKGGTGNAPRADFGAEVRRRNSVITGNAPGGASFRGRVGYRDPSDFTSSLGSDTNYGFRRDSIFSGLGGMGYRGTEAIQYQFANATGNSQNNTFSLTSSRLAAGVVPNATSGGRSTPSLGGLPAPSAWRPDTERRGNLRSTSSFTSSRSLVPSVIGYRRNEAGTADLVAASSLLGIKTMSSTEPKVRTRSPNAPTSAAPKAGGKAAAAEAELLDGPAANPLAAQPARTAFDEFQDRLGRYGEVLPEKRSEDKAARSAPSDAATPPPGENATQPGNTPSTESKTPDGRAGVKDGGANTKRESSFRRRMDELRDAVKPENNRSDRKQRSDAKSGSDKKGGTGERNELAERNKARRDRDATTRAERSRRLDPETVAMIRKASDERTKSYIGANTAGRDVFAEQIREGERLLLQERYFDAEERFSRALTFRPGDVSAMAGRLNSQLGTGLYSSAALNLHSLLTQTPEAAGMRFDADLLPTEERLGEIVTQLKSNIAGDVAVWKMPRECGMLLSYIGYQTGKKDLIEIGYAAFKKDALESDAGVLELIERVWLGKD